MILLKKKFLIVFILTLSAQFIQAKEFLSPLSAKELFAKYQKAVVKITIYQQGIPVSFGSGFFVSSDGTLVTNYHVLKTGFSLGYTVDFKLKDGKVVNKFLVGDCSGSRHIDLCVLKLKFHPKVWFAQKDYTPSVGEEVFVIGHPRGYDFSLSSGLISGIRNTSIGPVNTSGVTIHNPDENRISEIQVSAPISPGNSGGPIFDHFGNLVAAATWIRVDSGSQNLNFGISSKEIFSYVHSIKKFGEIGPIVKTLNEKNDKEIDRFSRLFFKTAFDALDQAKPLDANFFKRFEVEIFGKQYSFYLNHLFKNCETQTKAGTVICDDSYFQSGFVIFQIINGTSNQLKEGKHDRSNETKPLKITQNLIAAGKWENYKKGLTSKQIKYLYSITDPWKCKSYNNSSNNKFFLLNNSVECVTNTYNDLYPNAVSMAYLTQKIGAEQKYKIEAWTSEPSLLKYYAETAAIIQLTFREIKKH